MKQISPQQRLKQYVMNMQTNENKNNERNNLLAGFRTFAVRGAFDENAGTTDTAKNKSAFNANPKLAAQVAHFVAAHGFGLTSIKTWFDNDRKSGLNQSQATALSRSAWTMVKESGIDCKIDNPLKGRINDHFAPMIESWLSADEEPLTEEDLEEDEPLSEETVEDLLDTASEASVESPSMVSLDEIMSIVDGSPADRSAMVQGAILAFTAPDNANGTALHFHRHGVQRKNGLPATGSSKRGTYNLTDDVDFLNKVAQHGGANLAGLACWRDHNGDRTFASSLMNSRTDGALLAIAWCAVAVKAGVVTFDHDLRKYVTDKTITALRDRFVNPSADMTHPSASTNGWFLPYKRGDSNWKKSGEDFASVVNSLLI